MDLASSTGWWLRLNLGQELLRDLLYLGTTDVEHVRNEVRIPAQSQGEQQAHPLRSRQRLQIAGQ